MRDPSDNVSLFGAACCYVRWNFRQTAVAVAKTQDGGWLMKPDKVQSSPNKTHSM
jgi:hypothetical protein